MSRLRAMLHDVTAYPNPLRFNPDRYLKDGKLDVGVRDPETAAFGFGRRKCPGRHFAKESLWISIASILASFTIGHAEGLQGEPIALTEEYEGGLML